MAEFQNWNLGREFQAGLESGQQRRRQDQFRALAGQAINAPAAEREFIVQQAIANDPETGFALQKQLDSDTDRRQKALFNMARGFKQIHSQNPTAAAAFYSQQLVPGLSRLGFQVSNEYNEAEVLPVVEQVLAAYGAGESANTVQSTQILRNGNIGIVTRDGRVVDTGEAAAPQTQLISQPGQTPFFAVSGRGQIGQTIDIGGGGGQATAPAQGPVVTNQQGERGRYSIGADGLPVFIAEGVSPNIEQGITADPAAFQQPTAQAPAQFVGGPAPSGPRPVRNQTKAEEAADATTGRILAERDLTRPQDIAKDEQAFRKELDAKLDEPRSVLTAYERVQAAAQSPSAANDLALIFGYMKMLDPGSVVREGEFANAQNTGGIPDRIWNAYNRALNGERLNPAQRQEFVSSANQQADIARRKIDSGIKQAQRTARQYEYDVERATGAPDFSGVTATVSAPKAPPQPKGIPRPKTQAEFDRLPSGAVFIDPDDGKTYRKP